MEKYYDIIKEFLIDKFNPYLIVVYGSAARGETHEGSDIDVAFLGDNENDYYNVYMESQKLADLVRREIDLVDLSKASTVMRVQIIGKGKIIYNGNPNKSGTFMMKALKQYSMLNEERQCILDRIRERGSIYAK